MMIRTREQLLGQRTATVNALRGHLAEFGLIAPVGLKNIGRLRELVGDHPHLPELVVAMAKMHFSRIDRLSDEIDTLTGQIKNHFADSPEARRLQAIRTHRNQSTHTI